MNPYHYAKSFFSNEYLPQQVTWWFAVFLLSLVLVIAARVNWRYRPLPDDRRPMLDSRRLA